jgi:hypothetical protein
MSLSITDFYKKTIIDPSFDYIFYQNLHPETISYYQPFCKENNIPDLYRLYHHYFLYGKSFGYAKNLSEHIEFNVASLDFSKFYTKDVESICPVYKKYIESYTAKTDTGKKIAKDSNIAIVSLARNCGSRINNSIALIQKLIFKNWDMFIYENDSSDNTKDVLSQIKDNHINYLITNNGSPYLTDRSFNRTNNLARYRNLCLDWISEQHTKYDYIIVLDLDADLGFSIDGIYNSIGWLNSLDNAGGIGSYSLFLSITKNNIDFAHYDSFAARLNDWEPIVNDKDINNPWFRNWHPLVGSDPVPMYSCFGGLATYKAQAFLKGRYNGVLGSEHIEFHKSLRDNGYHMYLNPSSRFFSVYNNEL